MDLGTYLGAVLALLFVLALIALAGWMVRRLGLAGAVRAPRMGRQRRLAVIETLALDAKRRLVLVQRDEVEHLVLLGGGQDLVIETGIGAPRPDFSQLLDAGAEPADAGTPP